MNLFLAQKTNPFKLNLAKLFALFLVFSFVGGVANNVFAQDAGDPYAQPVDIKNPMNLSPEVLRATRNSNLKIPTTGDFLGGLNSTQDETVQLIQSKWIPDSFNPDWINTAVSNVFIYKDPKDNAVYQVITATKEGALYNDVPMRYTYKIFADGTKTLVDNPSKWPTNITELRIEPIALNNAGGPLRYAFDGEFSGRYVYTDQSGKEIPLSPVGIEDAVRKLAKENPNQTEALQKSLNAARESQQTAAVKAASNSASTGDPTKTPPEPDPFACTKFMLADFHCLLAKGIYYITIVPAGWLLYASGALMNAVFKMTVVELSQTLYGKGFYTVIKLVWGMFRDIINMSFIFLLLYASIMTILKADTGRIKQMVSSVIIVAILINFSLFFATTIIDFSNTLAVGIYNQINQGVGENNNLAHAYMSKLGLQTLMTDATSFQGDSKFNNIITISIFGSVFILVLAVVFFVISILFIVRFVTLIILMMMSPVGIAGIAVPKLKSAFGGDGYWSDLLAQCFFAPIMIFFLWISIRLLDAVVGLGGTRGQLATTFTDSNAAAGGLGSFILGFTVIVFILIKGMEIAKSMSAKGAGAVQKGLLKYSGADRLQTAMKNAPRNIGGGIKSTAGAGARTTAGRIATNLSESKGLRDFAARNAFGRGLLKATYGVSDAKFGGKASFAKNREDVSKERIAFDKRMKDQTFAEKEEVGKALAAVLKATEGKDPHEKYTNLTAAEEAAQTNAEKTKLLNDQKTAVERDISHAEHIGDTVALASSKAELKTVKEEIEKTDNALLSAFKKAGVEIAKAEPGAILDALKETSERKAILEKENKGIDFTVGQTELLKQLEELNKTEKAAKDSLKGVNDKLKDEAAHRSAAYQKNLRERRFGNFWSPSKTDIGAATSIRKANKEESRTTEEDRKLAKMIKESLKPSSGGSSGGEKKEEKKDK